MSSAKARDTLAAELKEQKVNNKIAEFVAELRDEFIGGHKR